jgi:AbrB family looped-hinge helix DNA binding protein
MEIVTVSSRFQVVIPASIREQAGLKPGVKLLVDLEEGRIVMRPRPERPAAALRGLFREVWEGVDPEEFQRQERESWGA